MLRNDQLDAWDRESFLHPSTHLAQHARGESPARIMTRGADGVFVEDREGHRLLDAFAGLYCVNVGYGRTEIAEAIAAQAHELAYYHAYAGHGTEASITLAKMVIDRCPAHMSKVFFGLGGSDANETNLKIIWYVNNILGRPEKKKIIARWRGYHGSGIASGSLTGLSLFHAKFDLPLGRFLHTEAPYPLHRPEGLSEAAYTAHLAAELEALIEAEGADTIAAFWAEPLLATGGIIPPPEGYWEAIQPILKKHDILLVVDEVVTGFGRMGTMMGSEYFGLRPDVMTIAKGLTSAYAPLSGSIVSDEVWSVLERGTDEAGPFGHGLTYAAHPIGAAAGVANLRLLDELGLVANAADMGPRLTEALRDAVAGLPQVAEVRGAGMLSAIEVMRDPDTRTPFEPEDKMSAKMAAALLEEGIIGRAMPQSDTLGFAPPLCLTEGQIDQIATGVGAAMRRVLG